MANLRPSNLAMRLLTAAVVAPVLLAVIYLGPVWLWYLLVLACTCVGGWEFFAMTHAPDRVGQVAGTSLCAVVSIVLFYRTNDTAALLTLALGLPLFSIGLAIARLGDTKTAATRMTATVFGPWWIGMLSCLALLRRDQAADGPGFVVLALMLAWWGDTGGYFAGRYLGRRKLYAAISPKKTVEGLAGALAGAALGAICAHFWYLPSLPLGEGIVFAVMAGAAGQAGDLGESLLKRACGVKDSGEIVPGHGGVLDRADALFVTSALVYLYTRWR